MLSWIKKLFAPAVVSAVANPPAAKLLQAAARSTTKKAAAGPPAAVAGAANPGENRSLQNARLIMVTADNNNKFYEMQENENGTFTATYGRVGSRGTTVEYPMSEWDGKRAEKVRKGYKDHTALFTKIGMSEGFLDDEDPAVRQLIEELAAKSRQSILDNYHVSANQVTKQQVEKAQALLDSLSGQLLPDMDLAVFNKGLLALYEVIPRKMKNVRSHLLSEVPATDAAMEELGKKLATEQATLDVMRSEVEALEQQKAQEPGKKTTRLEALGLEIEPVTDDGLVQQIRKMMGPDHKLFKRAYKVSNFRTQAQFDRYVSSSQSPKNELFWHGSRNENWLSILKTGLVLRPANAVITGKMFGYGLYFADKFRKSLNYTSLSGSYWASGKENKAWLALYEVHVGNQLVVRSHESWCYNLTKETLKQKGAKYDSVYAKSGISLVNNEYIVYDQAQCTVRYLVEVGA